MSAAPAFTAQQAAAIRCRRVSVALSAGAGCGKTFVLTQRFLSHLEPGSQPAELHRLVAITFTDRAAREMRDRIRAACQAQLAACPSDAVDQWLKILRGLDAARISTIHSFCASLLRSHAVEAEIDPRFALLEPALADTLLQTTTNDVVHRLLIADDQDAVAFVLRFGLERTRSLAARLAHQRFRIEWSAWDVLTAEQLADRWQATWTNEFVAKLAEEVRSGPAAARLRDLLLDEAPSHKTMQERCVELHRMLSPKADWSDAQSVLQMVREVARVQGGGGKSAWRNEEVYEVVRDSMAELREQADRVAKVLAISPDDVALAAELALRGVRLARQVADAYATAKQAAGVLDFDDLLLLARDLLRSNADVRQRFAAGFDLLLVDEFQDTDPVQAEIVRHLCGAALTTGRLFLVGDVKQSIYRFRRADPGVFQSLRAEIAPAGQLSLTENFRSQPEILSFVNLLFRPVLQPYEALTPFAAEQLSPRPCIEFLWATTDAGNSSSHTPCAVPDGVTEDSNSEEEQDGTRSVPATNKASADELREREADWIARRIAELIADDTPRIRTKNLTTGVTELRRVQPRDITILFRALSNVALYEAALRRYGLDYYLVGGKAFYAQQEVFDLLNLCRCLDDPSDAVALVGVLRSPLFGLSDDAIHSLQPANGDWWHRLQQAPPAALPTPQQERIRFASGVLSDLRRQKDRRSIADLLGLAIRQTGYDAALLAEHLGRRKVANLRKLIEEAVAFDRGEVFTLKDFVERLQTSVFEQTEEEFATTLPEAGEVIRLMSVHQAKGLEFAVVIVADIDRKGPPKASGAHLHSEWGALIRIPDEFGREHEHLGLKMLQLQEAEADEQESRRLFYVATTRAKDHLILSAGLEPELTPHSPWLKLLSERFALDTGLPKGDPLLGTLAGATERSEIPEIRVQHQPPSATPVAGVRDHRSLEELVLALSSAVAEPLPVASQRFPSDASAPRIWNVSQLEELAGELFPELRGGHGSQETAETAEVLGTLLHGVLERVDFSAPGDGERLLNAALEALPQPIEERQADLARTILQRFAESDIVRRLTTARQVWREFDFVLPWPRLQRTGDPDAINGQVDCCFLSAAGTWHLIDYKTGDYSKARSDAEIVAPYRLQLGLYALAVEQWWGRPLDSIELVIFRPEVRCLPWRFDAAARRQLQQWVDRVLGETELQS